MLDTFSPESQISHCQVFDVGFCRRRMRSTNHAKGYLGTDSMISLEGIELSTVMNASESSDRLTKNVRCWIINPGEFVA